MYEEELAGKIRAHEDLMKSNAQTTQGVAGIGGELCQSRPGLRERVAAQIQGARRERRKIERLEELSMLLAKHPDVARILDLLEETSS